MYPPPKIFTIPIYPPSQNLAKTSSTLPLESQIACIYEGDLQEVKTKRRNDVEESLYEDVGNRFDDDVTVEVQKRGKGEIHKLKQGRR